MHLGAIDIHALARYTSVVAQLDIPHLSKPVLYFDENKQPCAAIVVYVWPKFSPHLELPICNLATFDPEARFKTRTHVEPAYKAPDGRWHIINKWANFDVVPEEEWNYLNPTYQPRKQEVGAPNSPVIITTSPPRYARRIQNRR